MLGTFIVRQRRSGCIIHLQLESCSNVHNSAANLNTLPSLNSAGSLKPIASSSGIVHHCAIHLLHLLYLFDCNHQLYRLSTMWLSNCLFIRIINEYFDQY